MEGLKLNKIIPELLTKSRGQYKELKNRFTVYDVFASFENRTAEDFKKYLSESTTRYRECKAGNGTNYAVTRSMDKIASFNKKILSEPFYTELNIDKEKEQIRHPLNTKENKEIISMMKTIVEETNPLPQSEKEFREYLNEVITEKKKRMINLSRTSIKSPKKNLLKKPPNARYEREQKDKLALADIFNKDEKMLNTQINNYRTSMNTLIQSVKDGESEEQIKKKRNQIAFNPNRLRMLSYQKPKPNTLKKKTKNEMYSEPINMKKIMYYTKPESLKTSRCFNSTETTYNPCFKGNQTYGKIITNYDFSDSRSIVRDSALNSTSLNRIFEKKKKKFNHVFKNENLPKLEEYSIIIKEKLAREKLLREEKIQKNYVTEDTEDSKKTELKKKLQDNLTKWKIQDIILMDFE